jgi:hypothetical protein
LYGPQLLAHRDAILEVGKALGKEIKIKDMNADEARSHFQSLGFPSALVDYFVNKLSGLTGSEGSAIFPLYEEGVENVKLYTGRPGTTFQEWLAANKELFAA